MSSTYFKKIIFLFATFTSFNSFAEDCVVLLHGLASHEVVMKPLELALDLQPELRVQNESYNSYSDEITLLANKEIPKSIEKCATKDHEKIHFVTHSMGGLLLRAYLREESISQLGRVVMIAPPNHGSEIVDLLHKYKWLANILGPAGRQLSTNEKAFPQQLQDHEVNIDLGIIAGDSKNSWLFASLLPEADDGTVSTESAKLPNMKDFVIIESSHSGLLIQKETIEQTLSFLRYGKFGVDQIPGQASK